MERFLKEDDVDVNSMYDEADCNNPDKQWGLLNIFFIQTSFIYHLNNGFWYTISFFFWDLRQYENSQESACDISFQIEKWGVEWVEIWKGNEEENCVVENFLLLVVLFSSLKWMPMAFEAILKQFFTQTRARFIPHFVWCSFSSFICWWKERITV